ncbi:hypothetical protein FS837_006620 [Tulasnella sp. UAMH 9824]|nr:hypothetical protein FS837_006620 [Tulasnella sp. UAMH 9824]
MYSQPPYSQYSQSMPSYNAYQQPAYQQQPAYSQYQNSYAPPPPNPHQMGAQEFRQWFLGKLAELVVNQKNIIHNLAFIANEHVHRMGQVIADSLEYHIRKAHPQVKLPAWYLLDSIAKNIGHPYTQLFSKFIVRLFLDSYHAVDLSTRSKMEEMLVTWRTGARGGVELFGPENQLAIEKSVWSTAVSSSSGRRRSGKSFKQGLRAPYYHMQSSSSASSSRAAAPSKAQVLTELEVILAQKTRAVELDPYDTVSAGHVDTLTQLRTLVQSSSISPQELTAIATQLRNLARSTASAAPPLPPMVPPSQPMFAPVPPVVPPPPTYSGVPSQPATAYSAPVNVSSAQPSSAQQVAPAPADISALFQNLVKAGVVSAPVLSGSGTPSAVPAPAISLPSLASLSNLLASVSSVVKPESESTPAVADPQEEAQREYERAILSFEISMTASGIQRENLNAIPFLYDRLPLQCKQCAQRFPDDGPASKKRYDDHTDGHFRQNLRNVTSTTSAGSAGTIGRGYTRSWFVGKQDWVKDVTRDASGEGNQSPRSLEKGKGRALSPVSGVSSAEREAKLRASYVIIPPGDEARRTTCPICKETIKTEFLDDEEEWVWRNAVSAKGKIYHATCHADALAANLARVKHEGVSGTGRSRSATPDIAMRREDVDVKTIKASPLAGVKRKVSESDDEDSDHRRSASLDARPIVIKAEETDSPRPFKKQALTPA